MTVAEAKELLDLVPDDLELFFLVPNNLELIISNRGRMPVTDIQIGPADFGRLVRIVSE